MINPRTCSFLILGALSFLFAASCEVDCGCEPEKMDTDQCQCFDISQDVLMIADFEDDGRPNDCGGSIGIWKDMLSNIEVWVTADTIGGGAQNSRWYAKLAIVGNDGVSPAGWTGGGLLLNLSNCQEGIDLSNYDSLQFEVKTSSSSNLEETRIKLGDTTKDSTPERYISSNEYGNFPSEDWKKISIPVDHFDTILYTDTSFHNWMPLDISKVTKIVTVSINDGAFVSPVNGVLYFDNFRLVRKR